MLSGPLLRLAVLNLGVREATVCEGGVPPVEGALDTGDLDDVCAGAGRATFLPFGSFAFAEGSRAGAPDSCATYSRDRFRDWLVRESYPFADYGQVLVARRSLWSVDEDIAHVRGNRFVARFRPMHIRGLIRVSICSRLERRAQVQAFDA